MDDSTMEHAIDCIVAMREIECEMTNKNLAFRINTSLFSLNFYNLGTCEIYFNLLKFITTRIIYFSLR